jgi:hypothetical protein
MLWPTLYDEQAKLMRYRAKPSICNACPVKTRCTTSPHGREIIRETQPWPHSEAGRFHRVLALLLVGVAAVVVSAAGVRNHSTQEAALLVGVLALALLEGLWLARDLHRHPAGFPMGVVTTGADGVRPHSRWASQRKQA